VAADKIRRLKKLLAQRRIVLRYRVWACLKRDASIPRTLPHG